jgi:hypothetical protein
MRHTPHVAQQPGVLPSGQGQRDRKDSDSKHGSALYLYWQQTGQPPHVVDSANAVDFEHRDWLMGKFQQQRRGNPQTSNPASPTHRRGAISM